MWAWLLAVVIPMAILIIVSKTDGCMGAIARAILKLWWLAAIILLIIIVAAFIGV